MKKFSIMLFFCMVIFQYANAVEIGNLVYNLNSEEGTAVVTGLVGGKEAASGDLVIPETVEYEGKKYSVTSIGEEAFSWCSGFKGSLTI
ncbi:MAG: hypothetical protein K2H84_06345, partial [Paramuribaculum sp.]|nr:hypothetical protein [Paramuribaculum sp.]